MIVADRVRFKGNDRLWAGGKVTIDRSDFAARGDSLRLDTGTADDGTLLGERPELRGLGTDSSISPAGGSTSTWTIASSRIWSRRAAPARCSASGTWWPTRSPST